MVQRENALAMIEHVLNFGVFLKIVELNGASRY